MQVQVVNNGKTNIYSYDPEHYDGVVAFYENAQTNGEIESYTLSM